MFSPCWSTLGSETSGMDAAMKPGEDPSSLCKLRAAGAKDVISVEARGRKRKTLEQTFRGYRLRG
jgi:hypothetical protein